MASSAGFYRAGGASSAKGVYEKHIGEGRGRVGVCVCVWEGVV